MSTPARLHVPLSARGPITLTIGDSRPATVDFEGALELYFALERVFGTRVVCLNGHSIRTLAEGSHARIRVLSAPAGLARANGSNDRTPFEVRGVDVALQDC